MSVPPHTKWQLKPEPDAYGFLYGEVVSERGESLRVDVMPPKPEWRGQIELDGFAPHATEWVAYLEGTDVARSKDQQALAEAIDAYLAKNVIWLDRGRGR